MQTFPTVNTLISTTDFTITANGEGFVSQTQAAKLCGVNQSAMSKWINRAKQSGIPLILNDNNQLSEETLVLGIAHYAAKGNTTANTSALAMMKAGVRAYIYTAAGLTPPQPAQARIAELENTVALLSADRHRTEARAAVTNADNLKTVIHNQHAALQHWVAQGFLDCDAKTRTEYKYHLTDHGKMHGFQQNRNGTVLPPPEWVE